MYFLHLHKMGDFPLPCSFTGRVNQKKNTFFFVFKSTVPIFDKKLRYFRRFLSWGPLTIPETFQLRRPTAGGKNHSPLPLKVRVSLNFFFGLFNKCFPFLWFRLSFLFFCFRSLPVGKKKGIFFKKLRIAKKKVFAPRFVKMFFLQSHISHH